MLSRGWFSRGSLFLLAGALPCAAATGSAPYAVAGIPLEFFLFGLTLLGVALWHQHTLRTAVLGLAAVLLYKLFLTDFHLGQHLAHEWRLLLNLFGLLMGFAVLAKQFEDSKIPDLLPRWLPSGWLGGVALLWMVFVLSSFLDNIAAAIIGATVARVVFHDKVHLGYLAAIVAASNAGGSGSPIGDTTTTMIWVAGVPAHVMFTAYVAAGTAMLICGSLAAAQQQKLQPIQDDEVPGIRIDWMRVGIVVAILIGAILANVYLGFPAVGVWAAILLGQLVRPQPMSMLASPVKGSIFLLSLVMCASMMPVDRLPAPSWPTALSLGFISAVFDNIPLTKLALDQGGYDWDYVAYAVGFGGSMIWFGSSAGVAVASVFPEAKSAGRWLRQGWHVTVAYVVGFFLMLGLLGWHPSELHQPKPRPAPAVVAQMAPEGHR